MIAMVEIAGRGGICHYAYNLCSHLQGREEVLLLTGKRYELDGHARRFRVEGIFDRLRTPPSSFARFLVALRRPGVRIAHFQLSQYPAFILALCLAAKAAGIAVVVTAHNVVSHEARRWEKAVYGLIYRLADRIIVHAENNRAELAGLFPFAGVKAEVIPHGNYMFFEGAGEDGGRPSGPPCVLFFGYIRAYKGLMHLIRAAAKAREQIPDIKLVIAGTPVEDFSPYAREIRRLGMDRSVTTDLGYVPFEKVKEYFTRSWVVALPYLTASQSGVLQLAYAFSRPVIVTRSGGMAEAVEEGMSGFVVPPGDEDALAQRLSAFFSEPGLRLSMGRRALELARTKFSWDRIADRTMELYAGVRCARTASL